MMRFTRGIAVQAVVCGFLLAVSGCLFDEAGGATSNATEADGGGDGGMGGHEGDGLSCLDDFEECVIALSEEGEDPSVCEPILDGCDEEPGHEGPGEEACYADFEVCICDPEGDPEACEGELDVCLSSVDPCIDDIDPCAAAFEACLEETDCPEDCEPLLFECEVPPEEPCVDDFESCMHDTGEPELCEPMLVECFEPLPEEPDGECLAMFEGCVWVAEDPEVCSPILDECHGRMDEPPTDDPCVEEYESCVEYTLEDGMDPIDCEDLLLYCFDDGEPLPEDPGVPGDPELPEDPESPADPELPAEPGMH